MLDPRGQTCESLHKGHLVVRAKPGRVRKGHLDMFARDAAMLGRVKIGLVSPLVRPRDEGFLADDASMLPPSVMRVEVIC